MAVLTVNAAAVGTTLATGAGSITAITMSQPTAGALVDEVTPVTLLDSNGPPKNAVATLFSATIPALFAAFGYKPGVTLSPGLTAPTWPQSLGTFNTSRMNGIYVASCPAGLTLTVTS